MKAHPKKDKVEPRDPREAPEPEKEQSHGTPSPDPNQAPETEGVHAPEPSHPAGTPSLGSNMTRAEREDKGIFTRHDKASHPEIKDDRSTYLGAMREDEPVEKKAPKKKAKKAKK